MKVKELLQEILELEDLDYNFLHLNSGGNTGDNFDILGIEEENGRYVISCSPDETLDQTITIGEFIGMLAPLEREKEIVGKVKMKYYNLSHIEDSTSIGWWQLRTI